MRAAVQKMLSVRVVGLLVTALVTAAYLVGVPLLDLLELKTYDMRLVASAPAQPPANVAIVAVDEKSLAEVGRWPWSRRTVAQLVDRLTQMGARVIALDVFFSEPENPQLLAQIDRLKRSAAPGEAKSYDRLRAELDTDPALARAIARNGNVVLPIVFLWSEEETRHLRLRDTDRAAQDLETQALRVGREGGAESVLLNAPDPKGFVGNLGLLQTAARGVGHINMTPDPDGSLRRVRLAVRYQGRFVPAADLQAARLFLGAPELVLEAADYGITAVALGARRIPTDEEGRVLIRYYGPEQTVRTVSAADVLAGRADASLVKDRIVLVGTGAKGIGDVRVTPYGPVFPGVEIRASIVQNILDDAFLRRPDWLSLIEAAALLVTGLLLSFLLPRMGVRYGALLCAALLAGYLTLAMGLFEQKIWVSVVYPSTLIALLFVSTTLAQYFRTELEKRQIKSAFQYYVPAKVVDEIVRDVSKLRLGGDKRELTVLFSDIRGFTSMAESMRPEDLVTLLNVYLTHMTDKVFRNDGLLDKYIGDAVMAVYGAPIHRPDHAELACRTAMEMMAALRQLQAEWRRTGQPVLDIGIGINSGPMVVGNMGSQTRFDYTVIGDAVNLGSRIESMNKTYGTHILLSEYTYVHVRGRFPNIREIDIAHIRGRGAQVRLYELIPDGSYSDLGWLQEFERAYALYYDGRRNEAMAIFQALTESVGDPVSRYYLSRDDHPHRRAGD
jgi:adenylate cyclase